MWLQLRNAQAAAASMGGGGGGGERPGSGAGQEAVECRPAGCAPDAYKLFIGNVPKSISEQQLRPLFEGLGAVMELVVVRDKASHESKGSAFVWYATKAQADGAVAALHLRHVIPDPAGETERPLVVRRANTRKPMGGWPLGRQQPGPPLGPASHHLAHMGGHLGGMGPMGMGPGGRALLLPGGPPPGGLVNNGDTLVPMGLGWAGLEQLAGGGQGQHHGGGLLADGSSLPSSSLSLPVSEGRQWGGEGRRVAGAIMTCPVECKEGQGFKKKRAWGQPGSQRCAWLGATPMGAAATWPGRCACYMHTG
jgi:hypothetical protein